LSTVGAEVMAVEATLDDVARGHGRMVLVEGPAGVGKSQLLGRLARTAADRGLRVALVGDELGSHQSLAALAASSAPLALLIDEAQRIAGGSLRELGAIAAGIRERPLLVALAVRRPLCGELSEALAGARPPLLHIQLGPLTPQATRELVRTRHPQAGEGFCYQCFTLTGGNPLLLSELLDAAAVSTPAPASILQSVLASPPPRARASMLRQLEELGPACRALASAIAQADAELDLARAASRAGLELDRALEAANALLEAGLLAPGEPLRMVAPLVSSCLAAQDDPGTPPAAEVRPARSRAPVDPAWPALAPAPLRWLEHGAADHDLEDRSALARAWHSLAAARPCGLIAADVERALQEPSGEGLPIGQLRAAAVAALALLDELQAAMRVYAAASGPGGGLLARPEPELEAALALALLRQGRLEAATAVARSLMNLPAASPCVRALAAVLASHAWRERDAPQPALAALDQAARCAALAEQPLARALLLDARGWAALGRGQPIAARELAASAAQLAAAHGVENPALVAWRPLAALCHAASGARREAHQTAEEAVAIAERFGAPTTLALSLRVRARTHGGRAGLADTERACAVLARSPAELERARALVDHGRALRRADRLQEARAHLRDGLDLAASLGAKRLSRIARMSLLAAGARPRRLRSTGPEALTPAERRAVALARAGMSNRAIAEELVVTRKTVEWHLGKAYAKLGVGSREELERYWPTIERGLRRR
jgi:DNA-binding CsgD family transcriptional regulator